eukprot:Skav223992  [mRNA]  locus=scaffold1943:89381:98631:- [translate_table: standard]
MCFRFLSAPFDPGAFVPSPIIAEDDASNLTHGKQLRHASHAPGREAAGARRPLVDVVELCPSTVTATATAALPRCEDFKAWILHQTCQGGTPEDRLEEIGAGGFAGVACWSPQQYCFPGLLPRTMSSNGGVVESCPP